MSDETAQTEQTSSRGRVFWIGTTILILAMLALGWYFGQKKDQAAYAVSAFSCEPIPDGMSWDGSALVPLSASAEAGGDASSLNATALRNLESRFSVLGFPWMGLNADGLDVDVTGTAPGSAVRIEAFDVASRLIRNDADLGDKVGEIQNEIDIETGTPAWVGVLEASVQQMGFDWLNLSVRGPVATLSGTAPSEADKAEAYRLTQASIGRNSAANQQIVQLVNGIVVEGGEASAADALVELSEAGDEEDLTVDACQIAFNDTMQGRNIEFETASAALSTRSTNLLDALTGIAILCTNSSGYTVEIGGHTDTRGDPDQNQQLSEARANSVQSYLIDLGVAPSQLRAVGYGESQPLMDGETDEAHARNRRTEFKVAAD
ncbi:MAG: hypothetical protein CMK09_05450 [Ponticaulis sp.]|nr:hypothetical protein [Ponticaulis sp.]|tara:strand:+ start:8387 stop:9517 length:1131 start_codon:yes stop_codon:yes gene_type:complete